MSGEAAEIRVGNALPLERIPLGTLVHNIELRAGRVLRSGPPTARQSQALRHSAFEVTNDDPSPHALLRREGARGREQPEHHRGNQQPCSPAHYSQP